MMNTISCYMVEDKTLLVKEHSVGVSLDFSLLLLLNSSRIYTSLRYCYTYWKLEHHL